MTIRQILKDCVKDILRRGYDHWLNKITLQLWRDARNDVSFHGHKIFVHNSDPYKAIGVIVDEILATIPEDQRKGQPSTVITKVDSE